MVLRPFVDGLDSFTTCVGILEFFFSCVSPWRVFASEAWGINRTFSSKILASIDVCDASKLQQRLLVCQGSDAAGRTNAHHGLSRNHYHLFAMPTKRLAGCCFHTPTRYKGCNSEYHCSIVRALNPPTLVSTRQEQNKFVGFPADLSNIYIYIYYLFVHYIL